jgi:hypothetical protein
MIHGFDFFKTLQSDDISLKIEELQTRYQINLPPLFKAFCQTFQFGSYEMHRVVVSNGQYQEYPSFHFNWQMPSGYYDSLSFRIFSPIEEIFNDWDYTHSEEWPHLDNLLEIGFCDPDSARLWVGVGLDNLDEIWLTDWNCAIVEQPTKIAKNVFEFVKMFYLPENHFFESFNADEISRLYKKWGEDIWRLSPEPLKEEKQ